MLRCRNYRNCNLDDSVFCDVCGERIPPTPVTGIEIAAAAWFELCCLVNGYTVVATPEELLGFVALVGALNDAELALVITDRHPDITPREAWNHTRYWV